MGALKSLTCSRGHPMVEENLYRRGDGQRECLTCKRERNRGRKAGPVAQLDRAPRTGRIPPAGEVAGSSPAGSTKAVGCPEHGVGCGYAKAGGWWCPVKGKVL